MNGLVKALEQNANCTGNTSWRLFWGGAFPGFSHKGNVWEPSKLRISGANQAGSHKEGERSERAASSGRTFQKEGVQLEWKGIWYLVGGWTNPFEKYCVVKLDHFPK